MSEFDLMVDNFQLTGQFHLYIFLLILSLIIHTYFHFRLDLFGIFLIISGTKISLAWKVIL